MLLSKKLNPIKYSTMEEKKSEIISKEEIEKVINNIEEAEKKFPVENDSDLDLNKVKEELTNLEGCSVQTAVGILTSAMLLLPAGAIAAVLQMGKQALKAKAFAKFMDIVGDNLHEDSEEDSEE